MSLDAADCPTKIASQFVEQGANYIRAFKNNQSGKDFLEAIRQHWSIEIHLHWVLDVAFREDDSRLRAENAAQNFVVLKYMALNLLQNVKGSKVGIKIRRFEATCND